MTHRTNPTIIVKVIDLNISCIYTHNHMVGMNKISSSDMEMQELMTQWLLIQL
jgi:hypothetical protein